MKEREHIHKIVSEMSEDAIELGRQIALLESHPELIYAIHKKVDNLASCSKEIHRLTIHPDDEDDKPVYIEQSMLTFQCEKCGRRAYISQVTYDEWAKFGPHCGWCDDGDRNNIIMDKVERPKQKDGSTGISMIVVRGSEDDDYRIDE